MHLKKKNNNFIIYIFIYFFFLIVTFYISNIINLDRHWSSFYDQEVTIAYNALLFNSGILQELNEHSGYFTIFFLSIFFKILNIINLLPTYKLSILNNTNNLDLELQNIIYFSRIFSLICVSFFLFITFIFFNYFAKNKMFSLLLSILILLSVGTIVHISQLRTELIAMIFLLLSLGNLFIFFKPKNNFKIYNISFFFLFLFCSILNKSQTFFYIPFIISLSIFLPQKIKLLNFNIKYFLFLKNRLVGYILFFIIFFYIIFKQFPGFQPYNTILLNITFLFFNIILINFFFYFFFNKSKNQIYENILIINLIMVLTFFLLKNILFIHPSTNEEAFKATFTNIMGSLVYIKDLAPNETKNIFIIIQLLFTRIYEIFIIKFSSVNYYSFLIIVNLLLNYYLRKSLKKNIIFFNISCILTFFFISSINQLRGAIQYSIFSDFFLILSYANFGSVVKKNVFTTITIILFFSLSVINKNYVLSYLNTIKDNNSFELCKSSYFNDWHKKISEKDFYNFCTNL